MGFHFFIRLLNVCVIGDMIEWQEKVLRTGSEMRERDRHGCEGGKSVYSSVLPQK